MITAAQNIHSPYADSSAVKKTAIVAVMFVLFAFLGWAGETMLFYYLHGEYYDRGLLTLPFCPLYGFGALSVYLILRTPQSGIWSKIYGRTYTKRGKFFAFVACLVLYAVAAAVLASTVEYLTGLFFDRKYGVRLWSYRRYPDNINGYVSIRYSLLWGLLCTSSMALIWHPVSNILANLPSAVVITVAVVLLATVTADFAYNMIYLSAHGTRFLPLGGITAKSASAYSAKAYFTALLNP